MYMVLLSREEPWTAYNKIDMMQAVLIVLEIGMHKQKHIRIMEE